MTKLINIKLRFMMTVICILIIAALVQVYYDNKQIVRMTDNKLDVFATTLEISLHDHLKHIEEKYSEVTIAYQSSPKVEQFMRENNRAGLYNHLINNYDSMRKINKYLHVMHFYDTKNITILRMHKPELFGDDLTAFRPMLKYVNENKIVRSGFEVGRNGVAYRVTIPMINLNGEYYGVVEYGIDLLYLADELMEENGEVEIEVLVKSKNLNNLVNKKDYKTYKDYSIVSSTGKLIEQFVSQMDLKESYQLITHNDKTYMLLNNLVLNDFNDNVVAKIMLSKDITELMNEYKNSLLLISIINFLIFTFIAIIIYVEFNKYSQKIQQLRSNLDQKDKQLFNQSRQAQMGEMISMIAHQWRQPLGAISSTVVNLKMKLEIEAFDLNTKDGVQKAKEYFTQRLANIENYVQTLTTTIDDFRNFYKPNKKSVLTTFEKVVEKALNIIEKSLEIEGIKLIVECQSKKELKLYENEMMQVILNILKNAQDNFRDKKIKNPEIRIKIIENSIVICDNGGGIPDDVIEKIFDPYFSTKDEKNGTGLGLYMSKIIVEEHHNGKFSVENKNEIEGTGVGACFIIKLLEDSLK